jgi:hypothetical protein
VGDRAHPFHTTATARSRRPSGTSLPCR